MEIKIIKTAHDILRAAFAGPASRGVFFYVSIFANIKEPANTAAQAPQGGMY